MSRRLRPDRRDRLYRQPLSMAALVATMQDTSDREVRRDALWRFRETLRGHIRWEEEVLFEVTQQRVKETELRALGSDLAERLPDFRLAPQPKR